MIERFFIHDIAIIRPGSKASRGSGTVADWSTSTSTSGSGWIAQATADDVRDNRTGDESEWVLQTSASTDVRPGDRVGWGSLTFDVVGRPNPAYTPRGEHHTECRLRVVEG
jgi:hypothetical protein